VAGIVGLGPGLKPRSIQIEAAAGWKPGASTVVLLRATAARSG